MFGVHRVNDSGVVFYVSLMVLSKQGCMNKQKSITRRRQFVGIHHGVGLVGGIRLSETVLGTQYVDWSSANVPVTTYQGTR